MPGYHLVSSSSSCSIIDAIMYQGRIHCVSIDMHVSQAHKALSFF